MITRLIILIIISFSGCSFFVTEKNYILYPIKSGDTLYAVAKRFDVTVADIQSINRINNPRNLRVGTELKIPYLGQDIRRREGDRQAAALALRGGFIKSSTNLKQTTQLGTAARHVGNMLFPIRGAGAYISSMFGRRNWFRFHEGIDIANSDGMTIYAAHSGKVVYSGSGISGYGNIVVIADMDILTVYAHNRRNYVNTGDLIQRGDKIAQVGESGRASGPHLHFEVRIKNNEGKYVAVDPMVFFSGS